jgi:predicted secreted protein
MRDLQSVKLDGPPARRRLTQWLVVAAIVSGLALPALAEPVTLPIEPGTRAEITLHRGQSVEVRLPANVSTGFGWEVAGVDASVVSLVGRRDERSDAAAHQQSTGVPVVVGVPSVQVLVFQAKGLGQTDVALVYVRPWERERLPANTAQLRVTVTD